MAHVRTQIRDRVMVTLTGLATTGSRVYRSRVYPMGHATMPGICVYISKETATGGTLSATEKTAELVVDAYVSGAEYDDAADQIQEEIESALYSDFANNRYFGGLAYNLSYVLAEGRYFGDAKIKHGILRMIYEVTYKTEDGNAGTAI